jgi:3-hydroxybutyryl-CoA dehydrogenase
MIYVDEQRVARANAAVAAGLDRLVKKAKLSAGEREIALARLRGTTDYSGLRICDLVLEAASENESLKLEILQQQVAPRARYDAIIATNTSSISITKLGRTMTRPQRFLGLHFFNPVPLMGLVEVVRGDQTDDATVEAAVALANRLGKTPVVVKDAGVRGQPAPLPNAERSGARLWRKRGERARHRRGDEARCQPPDRPARTLRPDRH